MKDDPTGGGPDSTFYEIIFKPPVWVAERFRPYYEYWRIVDHRFGQEMLPTWAEFREMRD